MLEDKKNSSFGWANSSPYHGVIVLTEAILNSAIRTKFNIIHFDTSDKRTVSSLGKFDIINVYLAAKHSILFIIYLLFKKMDLIYMRFHKIF